MSAPPMDPQYEQWLRDEVIYLHSLWHQGPPRPASDILRHRIPPNQPTNFKKVTHNAKNKKNMTNKIKPNSSSSGAEWPCPPTPPPISTEWPSLPKQLSPNPPVTLEEKSKFSGLKAQKNALEVARKFFLQNGSGGDDDEINSSDSERNGELMELDGEYGRGVDYGFFVKLMQDAELKEYYVKNFVQGEFSCLVCGALGEKMVKKYGSCLALVQHSVAVLKTKRRQAHRAFGQAVCKVLGWDINHLSAVASMLSESKVNADSGTKESNVNSIVDVVSLPTEHTSLDVQVNVDLANNESVSLTPSSCNLDSVDGNNVGVVAASGTVVSLSSEHTSGNIEVNVDMPIKETNVDSVVDVDPLQSEHASSDMQVNVDMPIKETNVDSVADVDPLQSEHASSDMQVNVDMPIKETNFDSVADVDTLQREHASSDMQVNVDMPVKETNVDSVADDPLQHEHASSDMQVNVDMPIKETNVDSVRDVNPLQSEHASSDMQNANSDNKDTSIAVVCNVDQMEGNFGGVVPASGASGSGV